MRTDYFKRLTSTNWTAWDLDCPFISHKRKSKHDLKKSFRRAARRIDRRTVKEMIA